MIPVQWKKIKGAALLRPMSDAKGINPALIAKVR